MTTDIIILAAGKGTRMRSSLPKVLHTLGGKPLLSHVIDTARTLNPETIRVVIGAGADAVKTSYSNETGLDWLLQEQQLGTGHAVLQAAPTLQAGGKTLILYGDVPLISQQTLEALLSSLESAKLAILTLETSSPHGMGRIIRNERGHVDAIVEEKDATETQKWITEVNTGIMAVDTDKLLEWLNRLDNNNAQGEYYLTDIVAMAAEDGPVPALRTTDATEVQGVNDRVQLSELERKYQHRIAVELARNGVGIRDMSRMDVRGKLNCGIDVAIDINAVFEGTVQLGNRVVIEPNVYIKDSVISDDVVIRANSHIEQATIGDGAVVGPYARLREGTVLESSARIGNFVETKKTRLGKGSKANHLTYLGDTEVGEEVNIGAGTITCNYDGANKSRTTIENAAFIGSNSSLVAPVRVGKNASVGAGSVITKDVENDQLAIARGRQRNIDGWKRSEKNRK